MFSSIYSSLVLIEMGLAAFGVGRIIWGALRRDDGELLSVGVWSTVIGGISWGLLLGLLGACGFLHHAIIGVMTLVAAFWGLGELMQLIGAAAVRYAAEDSRGDPLSVAELRQSSLVRLIVVLAAIAAGGTLISALAPPTAGDALCYHLELPKRFLIEHRLEYLPDHDNSTYPLLAEMVYLWALALDGPVAAQLTHWACGVLLALATVLLARPIIGSRLAWLAGACLLLLPGITNQMTAPLNDVSLALLTTLAIAATWRSVMDDGEPEWFVVAGIMLGGALGVKIVAVLAVAAIVPATLVRLRKTPGRRTALVRGALTTAIVAASVAGPWYMRAAWHRGNPVYPLLSEWTGDTDRETLPDSKAALGRSWDGLLAAPWLVTMKPERLGGRAHQLGPLLLMGVPLLLIARRVRGMTWLLTIAACYAAAWFMLRQNVRFLHPIAPVLAVSLAWAIGELRRWPTTPRQLAGACLGLTLLMGTWVPWHRARDQWQVAAGLESRDAYLSRREPTFAASQVLRLLDEPGMHVLSMDHRAFYLPCRVTREHLYRRRTHYDATLLTPENLSQTLREAGFTHLLLTEPRGESSVPIDGALAQLANAAWESAEAASLICLADYNFADADGERRYRLVLLR